MLLFIWVSEYKGLKNVELNFSDDFKFSFNSEELVLRVEKKNFLNLTSVHYIISEVILL